jgi:hypothetical protein
VLREAQPGSGRLYLDEASWRASRRKRLVRVAIAMAVIVVAVAVILVALTSRGAF